jgi:nitroreductase/NAD-dependent dihydropyrimidine dehydrogenase PreA subunit
VAGIHVDFEKCTSCGDCTLACSSSILVAGGETVRVADEEYCTMCGNCVAVCPAGAISIEGLNLAEFPNVPEELALSPGSLAAFLRSRRSCRAYAEKEVPRQLLEKLIDIARYAASGHNSQNFQFIVIRNRELIRTLAGRTAVFYGNLHKMLSAPEVKLPAWLQTHMRGIRLNWEHHQAGKDRIFRNAPALILVHALAENSSSAQNCHLAMANILLQANALGLGTCIVGYFLTAAERDPSIIKELEIPPGNKIFTCCTVGYPVLKFRKLVPRRPPAVRWL